MKARGLLVDWPNPVGAIVEVEAEKDIGEIAGMLAFESVLTIENMNNLPSVLKIYSSGTHCPFVSKFFKVEFKASRLLLDTLFCEINACTERKCLLICKE